MHKRRDSLLQLLVKWGIHEDFPRLAEQLAVEDITLPNLRRTVALAEILDEARKKNIPRIPAPGEEDTSVHILHLPANAEKTAKPRAARSYIKNWQEELYRNMKNTLGNLPPEVIAANYTGLKEEEQRVAFSKLAMSATLADRNNYPELHNWVEQLCEKGHVKKPRLVVLDSDMPVAMAWCFPCGEPTVFMSTNLMEIMNDRQLKAIIGHELRHVRERGNRGLVSFLMKAIHAYATGKESIIREEFRADAFAAKLTDSADDMVEALVALQRRFNEIKRFARQSTEAMKKNHVNSTVMPPRFADLLRFANAGFRVLNESDCAQYRKNNRADPHPPLIARFDALHAAERKEPGGSER